MIDKAKEWLKKRCPQFFGTSDEFIVVTDGYADDRQVASELLAEYAQAETAHLASRVQELEEALRLAAIHLGNFANEKYWSDEVSCLQWIGKRHAIDFAKEAQAQAERALAGKKEGL